LEAVPLGQENTDNNQRTSSKLIGYEDEIAASPFPPVIRQASKHQIRRLTRLVWGSADLKAEHQVNTLHSGSC
jgi:hypothetical protein